MKTFFGTVASGVQGGSAELSLLCSSSHACAVFWLLIICLTAHHLVNALLAIALSFLTYFCIYSRTTVHLLQHCEAAAPSDDEVFKSCDGHFMLLYSVQIGVKGKKSLSKYIKYSWLVLRALHVNMVLWCTVKHQVGHTGQADFLTHIHTDTFTQRFPGSYACKPVRLILSLYEHHS